MGVGPGFLSGTQTIVVGGLDDQLISFLGGIETAHSEQILSNGIPNTSAFFKGDPPGSSTV